MTQPMNRGGTWWSKRADGTWLRWNDFTESWDGSLTPPPPPAPPPPDRQIVQQPATPPPPPAPVGTPAATAPPKPVAASPTAGARRPRLDLEVIRARLPYWADGPVGIALVLGLVILLFGGTAMAYGLVTHDPVKPAAPVKVEGYSGPVSWRGQRDIYSRLKNISGCTPQNIDGIERNFSKVNTAKGRIKYLTDGVEGLRGINFDKRPKMNFLTQRNLGREVARIVNKEYDRAQANLDADILGMLGAVPPGTKFGKLSASAAAASIAGLYVPEKKELYVGDGGTFGMLDELTLAHEIEHALADQAFGFPQDEATNMISDERNALHALIEGDAELTAAHYDMILDIETAFRFVETSPAAQAAPEDEIPGYFLQRAFFFPYFEGTLFVCELYAIEGWDGVNRAYADPPKTTAEILFPERYIFKITPKDPTDPSTPKGWKASRVFSLGAADLLWLFQAPGGHLQPKLMRDAEAVKRWNGGEVHVFRKDGRTAMSLALVDGGEDPKGKEASPTLCARVRTWYGKAFEDARMKRDGRATTWSHAGRTAILSCSKEGPLLTIAPDKGTAAALSR